MPDQKLSQRPSAASVNGSDQLYIVQSGQSKRASASQLPISTATATALAGKEASGAAADAIAAHLAAADPHPTYLTQAEAGALYAPLASAHDAVTLGATVADVLGLTGQQLTADDPGAGADRLLFWDHSAGRLRHLALGSGLTITDTTIDAAGGGYPAFSAPTGFSVTGSGTSSITLLFASGYSLPTTTSQASWDTAAGLAATAVQPAALSSYVQTSDSRLTDQRVPTDGSVTDAKITTGGLSASSVNWVAITAWAANTAYAKGDLVSYLGIAYRRSSAGTSGATFNATNWQQITPSDPPTHTQTASTISDSTATGRAILTAADAAAARSAIGAGTSSVMISSSVAQALGATAAAGSTGQAADAGHIHPLPAVVSTTAAGLAPATSFAALTYAATTDLDMSALDGQYRTITLTGDLTLTTSNRATGRTAVIRLLPGAAQRTLTFPVGWVFLGTKPATLAASKTAVLSLTFFGTADTDCVAAYAVQS
jgi:hypothetical protein